jgi:hypothetical protein
VEAGIGGALMKKVVKQKVGRKCSVCHHDKVTQINKMLSESVSFRNISSQILGHERHYAAVGRHADNCLKMEVGTLVREIKAEQAFDYATELAKLYVKATKMVAALEKWLADPDNPDEFNIDPRDIEMTVVYLDHADLTKQGEPKQKKGVLRELLSRIEAKSRMEPIAVMSSAMDNRKLYLDAFKTLNDRLEQIAKFYGHYTKDKENPATVDQIIAVTVASRLIDNGWTEAEARQFAAGKYPEMANNLVN